jgi:hypothetical protein
MLPNYDDSVNAEFFTISTIRLGLPNSKLNVGETGEQIVKDPLGLT